MRHTQRPMASADVCDACRRAEPLVDFDNHRLCDACRQDLEHHLEHQYEPAYSGIIDCAACGYPNSEEDAFAVEDNGRHMARCKECPHIFPWPAIWTWPFDA